MNCMQDQESKSSPRWTDALPLDDQVFLHFMTFDKFEAHSKGFMVKYTFGKSLTAECSVNSMPKHQKRKINFLVVQVIQFFYSNSKDGIILQSVKSNQILRCSSL